MLTTRVTFAHTASFSSSSGDITRRVSARHRGSHAYADRAEGFTVCLVMVLLLAAAPGSTIPRCHWLHEEEWFAVSLLVHEECFAVSLLGYEAVSLLVHEGTAH